MIVRYAIGDVHGRIAELLTLLDLIEKDMQRYPEGTQFKIIQIGDLIDRGEDSKAVIDLFMNLHKRFDNADIHILKGNHEDVLLNLYDGNSKTLSGWYPLEHKKGGGVETLRSYGADEKCPYSESGEILAQIRELIPREHIEWLRGLPHFYEDETYFFAHAGVRPGVPLDEQTQHDLLWVRDDFIPHDGAYEKVIVHGHSPYPDGEILHNRVNTDAGAAYGLHLIAAILKCDYSPDDVDVIQVKTRAESNWIGPDPARP